MKTCEGRAFYEVTEESVNPGYYRIVLDFCGSKHPGGLGTVLILESRGIPGFGSGSDLLDWLCRRLVTGMACRKE